MKELKKETEKKKKKQKWESKQDQMVEEVMSSNVDWETYFKKVIYSKV